MQSERLRRSTKIISGFLLVLFLGACGAEQNRVYALDPSVEAMAFDAKEISIHWLAKAQQNSTDSELSNTIQELIHILNTRPLSAPPASQAHVCNSNVPAFVLGDFNKSAIYICAHAQTNLAFFAQVLIHEALHLSGMPDECEVSSLELEIVALAERIPFKNAYIDACGIDY